VAKFNFRAQAAIDLRRREYDEARRLMASTDSDLRAAQHAVALAQQRAVEARTQWALAVQQAIPLAEQQWHRCWIVRLDSDSKAAGRTAAVRQADHARASLACMTAKQRLESLERFKEKALHAWRDLAAKNEQKELDARATMRFVARGSHAKPADRGQPER
jgi:flagellar export protein FliJ